MMKPGQNKVLYALYGVVEHSGTLHGGHYVAYVKVMYMHTYLPLFYICNGRLNFINNQLDTCELMISRTANIKNNLD